MKKYLYLFMMMCLTVILPSCGDDDDDEIDEAWKQQNEQAFTNKAFDSNFTRITTLSNTGILYYRQIKPGNGKRVYYNSRVDVYYEGSLIDGTVFDKKDSTEHVPLNIAMSSEVANYNSTTGVGYASSSNFIRGWVEILQFMTEGEEGEVWIPQEMGYGSGWDKNKTIPPYSTLIFKLNVAKVIWIDEI